MDNIRVHVLRSCSYATNGVVRSTEEVELINPKESLIEEATKKIICDLDFVSDEQILEGYTSKSLVVKRMTAGLLGWVEIEVTTDKTCEDYRGADGDLDIPSLVLGEFKQITGEMSVISLEERI